MPPDWVQGRTAFGGLIAAMGAQALTEVACDQRPLLSLDTAYVAPVVVGDLEVSAEVLRSGRNVTQAAARVVQRGAVVAHVHAVFGAPRESALVVDPPAPAPSRALDEGRVLPFLPGVTPTFTQHFEYRWTEGDMPFTGSGEARLGGWCRHRTEATGVEALIALLDAWPGPMLPLATRPVPASTVRWTAHLVGDVTPSDGWYWFEGRAVTSRGGYATTLGHLYAGDTLVAWTEQLVAVFDAR